MSSAVYAIRTKSHRRSNAENRSSSEEDGRVRQSPDDPGHDGEADDRGRQTRVSALVVASPQDGDDRDDEAQDGDLRHRQVRDPELVEEVGDEGVPLDQRAV